MDRRGFIKGSAVAVTALQVGGVSGVGALALLESGCNTGNLVSWTGDIVSAFQAASPILSTLGVPNIVALVADGVTIGNDLKAAFESDNTVGAVAMFDKLSGLFTKIMNDLGVIPVPMRIAVESVLALASIAIHLIASHLKTTVIATKGAKAAVFAAARSNPAFARGVATIEKRADEKPWGDYFRRR